MNLALKLLLKCQPRQQPQSSQTTNGFTMIELLIGTIMAFLIITPLLGFVVSILNDDIREQAKSETDFEQQAAISFVSEDLGQAYYIYSEEDDGDPVNEIEAIQGDLPDVDGKLVLVFWKQQTIPNSFPPSSQNIVPINCTPELCDDTTVRALVAYYLVQDDNEIWCQPEGGDCPRRIVRYVMKESVEKYRGTGVYYDDGELKDSQQGNVVFDPLFSFDNATKNIIEQETGNIQGQVLINYVYDFEVSDVAPTDDSAKITIKSDGKRRINANDSCKGDNDDNDEFEVSAFCPKATVNIKGLTLKTN